MVELSCEQNKKEVKTQCYDTLFYGHDNFISEPALSKNH